MRNALKCIGGKHNSSARVVDGKLILSFPGALIPVVWQMDLAQARTSALEIRENTDRSAYILTLKTMKGETVEVAGFADKSEAVGALMAAARALENAHGKIRPLGAVPEGQAAPDAPYRKRGRGGRWATAILGILLVFILLNIWASLTPRPPSGVQGAGSSATPSASFGQKPPENGVPLSADEFLQGR